MCSQIFSKVNWPLILALVIPNVGCWLSALSMFGQVKSPDGTAWYEQIAKPVWTPPGWVFGAVWLFLYTAMGYASYIIYVERKSYTGKPAVPFCLYAFQLLMSWMWSPIFFRLHRIGSALIHMVILNVAALTCTACFNTINKTASYWMMPYIAWLLFATCLNYSIWILNN